MRNMFGKSSFTAVLAILLCGLFLAAIPSHAQSSIDGAVAGTVVDSTGAALPGATVVVHSTGTNADTTVTANGSGYYRAERLAPGDYTLTVKAASFAPYVAKHVTIEVGHLTDVEPKLSASSETTVDVTSSSPAINTEAADFSTEFTPVTLATLPINGRHWTSFALLSPGVTVGASNFGLVTVRGATNLQNYFMIDGADDNEAFESVERGYTRVGYTTPEDAVLEFQVITSNYSAQYGRALGGGVNAVSRSGTNQFHGDAYWYYRDNDFGATNPFNTLAISPTVTIHIKPKDKRQQYGGSFNGPLIHDKLFFNYTFDQQKRNFPILGTPVPSFLLYTNTAYNYCTLPNSTTKVSAETCAEDRGVSIANVAAAENFLAQQTGVAQRHGNQILNFMKLDYKPTERNTASLIYDRMRWDSQNGIQTNPVVSRGSTSIGNDFVKVDAIIGKLDTLITSKISNELRFQYAREFDTENGDTPLASEPTTTAGGLPPGASISANGGTAFVIGTPSYIPRTNYPLEKDVNLVDNISMTAGKHTFNVGGDYRWVQDNIIDVDYLHGVFTYGRTADFFTDYARTLGGQPGVGCDTAGDTGIGTQPCYSNLQQAFGRGQFVYHTNEYAFYVQDDWKIAKRLTLNLGVRYDYEQMPSPKIPYAAAPLTAVFPNDKHEVGPRVGFAWDVYGTGKTLVHGGFGLYYGRLQNGTIFKALSATGSAGAQFQVVTQGLTSTPGTSPTYPTIVASGGSIAPPTVSNVTVFNPGFKMPSVYEMDASVQQDLGYNTVLTIAYLGSLGRELPNFIDANIGPPVSTLADPTGTKTYTFSGGPLAGRSWTVPLYTVRPNIVNGSAVAANVMTEITSNVDSNYNALSVVIDHRITNGIALNASYTFSKALDYDMNQSALSDTSDNTDPFNPKGDYGTSINDLPQRFVGYLTIAPKFALANKAASLLANGWTLAPDVTWQSGAPFSYGLSGGTALPGGGTTFNGSGGVAQNGSGASGGGASSAIVNFYAYRFMNGNAGLPGVRRNSVRGGQLINVDTRLSRSISVSRFKLTAGGEAFNLLNRENFTGYNVGAYSITNSSNPAVATASYNAAFDTPSAAGGTIYRERQIQFFAKFEF